MNKYINIGNYPVGYDRTKHGPYDPARYYGKPDTPFGEVKVGELGAWFGRREKGLRPFVGLMSRAFWRWQHKYVQPKRSGFAPIFQSIVCSMIFFYILNYDKVTLHKNAKYH